MRNKNAEFIKSMGQAGSEVKDFARIRSRGDKNSAITHDGIKVERVDKIFCDGYGWVECLPTTMHFIFKDDTRKIGRWGYMCTCGSIAGILSWKELGTIMDIRGKEGYALACVMGVTNRQNPELKIFRHADGSTE
jgi:hypothetical protein